MRLPGKTNTQKKYIYQKPALPKASGVQGTACPAPWAKSCSKPCPPGRLLLSAGSRASTTWWRKVLVFSKCVPGGCFTFLMKMWSHAATLNKCSCVRIAQFREAQGSAQQRARREPPAHVMCERTLGLLLAHCRGIFRL